MTDRKRTVAIVAMTVVTLCWLLLPALCRGDEALAPKAEMTVVDAAGQPVGDDVDLGKMIVITTERSQHEGVAGSLRWRIEGTSQFHVYPDKSAAVIVSEMADGVIRIQLIAARGGQSDDQVILIRCGRGPQPPPKPVDPDQVPLPQPVTGLRVLIVYETEAALTRQQLSVLHSTKLVAHLNTVCAKDSAGKAEWRKWDKTSIDKTGLKGESVLWQQLWKAVSPKLVDSPMVIVATDGSVTVNALPETDAALIALITKQAGGK